MQQIYSKALAKKQREKKREKKKERKKREATALELYKLLSTFQTYLCTTEDGFLLKVETQKTPSTKLSLC